VSHWLVTVVSGIVEVGDNSIVTHCIIFPSPQGMAADGAFITSDINVPQEAAAALVVVSTQLESSPESF